MGFIREYVYQDCAGRSLREEIRSGNERIHGCVSGWMDGLMDGWMVGWLDGWTDGRADE